MRNAIQYNPDITVGSVPDRDDIRQLKDMGFRTLLDLRDQHEKFSGMVAKMAKAEELTYIPIPISREDTSITDLVLFLETILSGMGAPYYCFSRFGKRPLAFMLLFQAVASDKPMAWIYKQAARMGISLSGEIVLQASLVTVSNSNEFKQHVRILLQRYKHTFTFGDPDSHLITPDGKSYPLDHNGFLLDPNVWDEHFAQAMASRCGIKGLLTKAHWSIIHFIRRTFDEFKWCPLVHQTCTSTNVSIEQFNELFPTGYLRGACKIAGVTYEEGQLEQSRPSRDVAQMITAVPKKSYLVDVRGFLVDPHQWDEHFAIFKSQELKMQGGLTDEQWKIIFYLREKYTTTGSVPTFFKTCRDNHLTIGEFAHLFPDGYHRGAVKIAGLHAR